MNFSLSDAIEPDNPRQELWKRQRETRGFDDTELWNLDHTFTLFILPRLKAFYEKDIHTEEFKSILKQIIDGFEEMERLKDSGDWNSTNEKIENGLRLFAENYRHLWD